MFHLDGIFFKYSQDLDSLIFTPTTWSQGVAVQMDIYEMGRPF